MTFLPEPASPPCDINQPVIEELAFVDADNVGLWLDLGEQLTAIGHRLGGHRKTAVGDDLGIGKAHVDYRFECLDRHSSDLIAGGRQW